MSVTGDDAVAAPTPAPPPAPAPEPKTEGTYIGNGVTVKVELSDTAKMYFQGQSMGMFQ